MLSLGMKYFSDTHWTVVGLLIFVFTFIGISAFTMWNRQAGHNYDEAALLPLKEEPQDV